MDKDRWLKLEFLILLALGVLSIATALAQGWGALRAWF